MSKTLPSLAQAHQRWTYGEAAQLHNAIDAGLRVVAVGDRVRYKPGTGVYGLEESLEADGRIPGVVVGFSRARVKVDIQMVVAGRTVTSRRAVEAKSLEPQA